MPNQELMCIGCRMAPDDISEYVMYAQEEGCEPSEFVLENEGTLNRVNGHFWCTECYIKAGQPLGKAP